MSGFNYCVKLKCRKKKSPPRTQWGLFLRTHKKPGNLTGQDTDRCSRDGQWASLEPHVPIITHLLCQAGLLFVPRPLNYGDSSIYVSGTLWESFPCYLWHPLPFHDICRFLSKLSSGLLSNYSSKHKTHFSVEHEINNQTRNSQSQNKHCRYINIMSQHWQQKEFQFWYGMRFGTGQSLFIYLFVIYSLVRHNPTGTH